MRFYPLETVPRYIETILTFAFPSPYGFCHSFLTKSIRDISGPSLLDRGIQQSTGSYNILF